MCLATAQCTWICARARRCGQLAERPPLDGAPDKLPHNGVGAELESLPLFSDEALRAAMEARILNPEMVKQHALCHQTMPSPRHVASLTDDEGTQGRAMCCFVYEGTKPGKCLLGSMGWLLSCRQAWVRPQRSTVCCDPCSPSSYAEGVEVL